MVASLAFEASEHLSRYVLKGEGVGVELPGKTGDEGKSMPQKKSAVSASEWALSSEQEGVPVASEQ